MDVRKANEMTQERKASYVTAIAFHMLVKEAQKQEMGITPVADVVYLPDEHAAQLFQVGCRAALKAMGAKGLED